jgi:hypothetical protein
MVYNLSEKVIAAVMVLLVSAGFLCAANVGSLLDLYNVRDDLSGSYKQTADINLSVTNPENVSVWESGNYSVGVYVKYAESGTTYTYICIQAATTQEPTDTEYWKELWESAKGWLPLGNDTTAFSGDYNGAEKKITNLYINRPDDDFVGIFGAMAGSSSSLAELKNIIIEGVSVTGRSGVGSLLGKINDNQYVVIDRCSVVNGSVSGYRTTGGLVGANNGFPNGNPANSRSKMYECFANVSVSYRYVADNGRTAEKIGGLVGCNQRGETYDSYALGDVSGDDGANSAARVGGLAGCVTQGLVARCFSKGAVTGSDSDVGGLIGNISGAGTGGILNSYWDTTTSGKTASGGGTGLTTTEMQTATPFVNWDTDLWSFSSESYPGLKWNANYTIYDVLTHTATLIYMGSSGRFYENADVGGNGDYLAFQSGGTETTETYLIFARYSKDTSLDELAGFTSPQNLSAYCKFWVNDQNNSNILITNLHTDSYFYVQMQHDIGQLWYRYNSSNWQIVPTYEKISGGPQPDNTYKIILSDLSLSSRTDPDYLEFAGDQGDKTPLPVTLSSFTAVFDGEVPILHWLTASEINNGGWNVYRAQSNDISESMQVNPELIQGQGTVTSYTSYEFFDLCGYNFDRTYFYWLESVDYNTLTEIYGPIALFIPMQEDEYNNSPYVPIQYGLHQNYPNPFNPTTEISFTLDYNSRVNLDIYSLRGRKVRTLLSNAAITRSEKNFIVWDGKDFQGENCGSGIYIYKLTTRREILYNKMVIAK